VRPDKWALFFHQSAYGQFARGRITGEQFATSVREAVEAPYLTDALVRAAHDAHIYAVDAEVLAVLESLKGQGVPLAFVTTANAWQTARERELIDLAGRYGPVVRSHEIRMTKTDPGVWSTILAGLGWQDRDPATILLVDDAVANCASARGAGLRVHQYNPTPVVGVEELRIVLREHHRVLTNEETHGR